MKVNIRLMGMYVHVLDIPMAMNVAVDHRAGAMHGCESLGDPLCGTTQVQHSEQDQHEADGEFHGEADARRDHQIEENDGCSDQNDRDGVSDAPENPDQSGVVDILLAAYDRADRDYMVGISCVPDAQQEAHADDRQQIDHVDLPGKLTRRVTKTIPFEYRSLRADELFI